MSDSIPNHARAVIIGGGIMGCSVAYHLAKLGWDELIILERAKLTSGSTFHAAGLVGQLRSSANITQLLKYSVELYDILEKETGQATGWKCNGGLRLACNEERWTEVRRQATTAHSFGLEMHLLSPSEAKAMWPMMDVDDLVGAAFLPTDGQVNPSDISQAMAKGARMRGVKCIEDCAVEEILVETGRAVGVRTQRGEIRCDIVVNCAGMWAREIGALAGVSVPVVPVQHQFMVSEPIDGIETTLPTLRDPDRLVYFKEEVGGLVMGGYELNPMLWATDGIPRDWTFKLIESDWDHFEQLAVQAFARVPALEEAGVRQLVNGPEAFTPDGAFILGEAPELPGFFVGAGFNAYGIAAAGGAGRALAEWIVEGTPTMDLWPVDIRRFGPHHREQDWIRTRTLEAYAHHYTMSWPHEEHVSGRPQRRSPLYDRLVSHGACFGEKMGWERPNWYAPSGVEPKDEYTYGYQNWFEHVKREHLRTRESVSLFDESSFAKFSIQGPDAEDALSWICGADVRKPPGHCTYTEMLNDRGGIECDLTVSRISDDEFYVITGTGYVTHDFDWIRRGLEGRNATLTDVTEQRAVLGLMGPKAREVLAEVSGADLSNDAFPFLTWQTIEIAGAELWAMRVTFVGELGWELHVPREHAGAVYDRLMEAGAAHGIGNAGYRCIESMRLEKAYRVWGSDITPDNTPLEAGLGWNVKLKTDMPFRGREALEKQKAEGLRKRFAVFTVDDPNVVLLGRETIHRDSQRAGWLTSGGFGHTVGKPIGLGYVRSPDGLDRDWVLGGSYQLEVAGDLVPANIQLGPLHDPKNVNTKG